MSQKAILVVSFGTTYREARENSIEVIEEMIADEFPEYEVYRAFTSRIVRARIKEKEGITIYSVEEALKGMREDGVTTVFIQPTHVIYGEEYEKILSAVKAYQQDFAAIKVGKPLLWENSDYTKVIEALDGFYGLGQLETQQAVLFMGHGSGHKANQCYVTFQKMLNDRGFHQVFVSTVEGKPDFDETMKEIEAHKYEQVVLGPLMIVAGDHAQNDLFGKNEDSWMNRLRTKGYDVDGHVVGIGELYGVQKLFVKHLSQVITEG